MRENTFIEFRRDLVQFSNIFSMIFISNLLFDHLISEFPQK